MYKLLHFISEERNLSEYKDYVDLEKSLERYVDGLEVILCGFDHSKYIRDEKIIGLHLPFYSDWLSYWLGRQDILEREYGHRSQWEEFYGGSNPKGLVEYFQRDMDYAQAHGVKYVVFHVSNVSLEETITRNFDYTDEEVIEATIDLVNLLFEGKDYDFDFLLENLPWPGLQFNNPAIPRRLLSGIKYPKTGFILDTGHMMQTNLDIESPEEGVEYIYKWFRDNKDLVPFVKGIHLHQSISGHIVRNMEANPIQLKGDFYEKFSQVYKYIFEVDRHEVCQAKNTKALIDFLDPEYLVYEFRSSGRSDREDKLHHQDKVLQTKD